MTRQKALILLLLLLFWAVSIRHLVIVPQIYEDEPWQASTGWKLATEGVFGSDMFAGFYGMEQHYYGYMPLHPLLLAFIFRLGGLGLFQARFEPVLLGILTLALTYSLGKRLFHPSVALLAVALLLLTRTSGTTPSQISGVLFLDITRISRYDMLVPVMGLLALHAAWSALKEPLIAGGWLTQRFLLLALAGFFCGLAGLSHLYGIFWFLALLLLLLWLRSGWKALFTLAAGFVLPWLPYLLYVWQAPADWLGQTHDYAPRFQLSSPRWYLQNLLTEPRRYGPGLGATPWRWLLRPGFWAFVVVVPMSLIALGRRMLLGSRAAAALFIPTVVLPLLFALLIYLKLTNYLVTVFPLLALTAAWGLEQLWRWATEQITTRDRNAPMAHLARIVLILGLILVAGEGLWRVSRLETAATDTTAHADFAHELQSHFPAGSRVLGLHHYWLALADYDYHSWAVPLLQIDANYWTPPLTVPQALDRSDPDAILIDRRMAGYLAEHPAVAAEIAAWMTEQGFRSAALVQDTTYGNVTIYLIEEPADVSP